MAEAEHFVDKHQLELIKRVSNVAPILDELLNRKVISQKTYDKIGALRSSQEKMRALCSTCLKAGAACKDVFYKILEENEPHLIADIKGEKDENVLDKVQVETMAAKKKLSETLDDLSSEELEEFKSLIELEKSFPLFSRRQQEVTNTEEVVELMVETYRQECVELTKKVLKKMNRTDLVQRFSDISSGTKEKQQPSLIQRVETMTSVIELLLETLKDLSDRELETFNEALARSLHFPTRDSDFQVKLMRTVDMQDTVFLMVQHYSQKSVDMTKKVLKEMRRTDLVQRLSDSSSGLQKKQSVDEHLSALIHKVATMAAVKELLLETFSDLSYEELKNLKWFLQFTFFQRNLPQNLWEQLLWTDRTDWTDWTDVLVDVMMETCGQQSVEVMREIFMDMNRTDLVQRLSESSSGNKEKHSVDEHWPALIQEVETLMSVTELLLETMKDLSDGEFQMFLLSETLYHINHSDTSWMLMDETRDKQDTVFFMVQTFGQQSVKKIKEVLKKMKRTDLVQRLSDSSSGFKNEQHSALIQRVTTVAAVKQLLLETLKDLRNKELKKFKSFLQLIVSQKELKNISWMMGFTEEKVQIVDVMVRTFGRQSVELTREVYMNMNRTDLVQRLSKSSSELKDKHSADENRRARFERNAAMRAVKQILLETLKNLSHKEFKKFKTFLQFTCFQRSLPQIEWRALEWAGTFGVVDLIVRTCGQQSVQVTEEIFMDMNRTDLLQRLSGASSGLKEKQSVAEQQSSLIQRVETMTSVIELLLETLKDLSDRELETFNEGLPNSLHFPTRDSDFQVKLMRTADMQDTVFLMVQHYSQKSVDMTKKVLKEMRRTDLVQRLSDSSSGLQKKQSVDEHLSALIHKVATMAAVKELLLETFSDLSYEELKNFKWFLQFTFFQRNLPQTSWRRLQWTNRTDWTDVLVDVMMEKCGQQSVEVMREIFMDMNRTDLVQRLSESSSGNKEKHSVDEHWPALIQEVETLMSVTELLLETLKDLSDGELQEFKEVLLSETLYHIRHSDTSWMLQETRDKQDTVFFMVQTFGQQSVEKIKDVLEMMKRTDLVQRLSDSSSGFKNEQHSALIQRVTTIAAVKQLLLETLKDLRYEELKKFKSFLQLILSQKELKDISWMMEEDRAQIVDVMMQTFGRQSVELTREVYMNMNRTDLVQRLSKTSSELKDKHSADEYRRARFEREAVEQILHETLRDLSHNEIEKFRRLLPFTCFQKNLPQISLRQHGWAGVPLLVDVMVQTCDQQSVEVTQEVLRDMNRTDLLQRLSETSSRLKGSKYLPELKGWGGFSSSSEEHQPKPTQKEVTMTPLQEKLFETLEDLSFWEFELFKNVLQKTNRTKGLPRIPGHRLELAGRVEIVKLMEEIYGQQSVEVTREILNEMNRSDLVQRLSDISSGSEGVSRSLELEGCGSIKQDTSDWTKLEPEVNSTDSDEAPTYSLQSETGSFECSVSGLRWTSKEKVSFKYQFCSWEEPMERMENLQYMPAGPLMDITVTAGRLDEVYLPHWICIDDNPKISESFAVLHIDDGGDVVEKVSEVTPSHVKLSEPIFSPRAALMKAGFPVKMKCKMLIYYKPNTSFLKLHVYLIPRDPALQQTMDEKKSSKGYEIIEKPHPDKYLKMKKGFTLKADIKPAKISPKVITLAYDSQDPNFYEVFIENPDRDFHLKLSHTDKGEPQGEPVWICEIRKDDYQTSAHSEVLISCGAAADSSAPPCYGATARVEHFVDKHQCDLIERVNNIGPILDNLLREGVIQQEGYDTICAMKTTQEKMRKLYIGPLKAGGLSAKDVFYKILEEKESYLVADLKRKES